MGIVEHQKNAKSLDKLIAQLRKEADLWQKQVFPRGTNVHVISDVEPRAIPCRVVSHYGGLENANKVIVEAIDQDDSRHFSAWRHVRDSWYAMPVMRVMTSELAAEYAAAVDHAKI